MNTNTSAAASKSPRVVCRTVRLWSAVFGEPTSGHATTCVDCRNHFTALQNLESELRRDAITLNSTASSNDFAQQIIRTVRDNTAAPVRAAPAARGRAWTLGGLAVAAACAFLVALNFKPHPDARVIAQPSPADGAEVIVSAFHSLSDGLVGTVIPSAGELVATNPLQQELGSVYSDMRSALDFLALNFLPSVPTAPVPQTARPI